MKTNHENEEWDNRLSSGRDGIPIAGTDAKDCRFAVWSGFCHGLRMSSGAPVRRIGPTGQAHGAAVACPVSFAEFVRRFGNGFSGAAALLPAASSCRQFRMYRSAPASAVIAGNDTPSVRLARKSCRNGNRNVRTRRERAWEGRRAELHVSGSRNGRTPFRSGGSPVRFGSVS